MKNPEELIGKKVKGFKFESYKNNSKEIYAPLMNKYIGKIGIIETLHSTGSFKVKFNDDWFDYPADQIESHLVDDEIPTLSDGVMMLVSDDEERWEKRRVFAKKGKNFYYWFGQEIHQVSYAKPLEPTKEEQLTAILGSSDKVSEIMELFKN